MGSIAFPAPDSGLSCSGVDRCTLDCGVLGVSPAMRFIPTRVFPSSAALPCHSPTPSKEFADVSPGSFPSCRCDRCIRFLPCRPVTDDPFRRLLNHPSTSGPCSTVESVALALRCRPARARSSLGLCSTSRLLSVPRRPSGFPFPSVLSHRRSSWAARLIPLSIAPDSKLPGALSRSVRGPEQATLLSGSPPRGVASQAGLRLPSCCS